MMVMIMIETKEIRTKEKRSTTLRCLIGDFEAISRPRQSFIRRYFCGEKPLHFQFELVL